MSFGYALLLDNSVELTNYNGSHKRPVIESEYLENGRFVKLNLTKIFSVELPPSEPFYDL